MITNSPESPTLPAAKSGHSAELASQTLARWNAMKTARLNWMIRWDDCSRYVQPRKGNILTIKTPGQDETINIYDTTAEEALLVCGAGIMTHIMPAGEKWAALEPEDDNADPSVIDWFADTTERVLKKLFASNFYTTMHEDMLDAACFGSSLILTEKGTNVMLNFTNIPVGTFAWEENSDGIVDTVGREWKWTARQAKQKWGDAALGPNVRAALADGSPASFNRQFTFVHFVEPRTDTLVVNGPAAAHLRPIRSLFICVEDQNVIEEGGYYSMPYAGLRLLRGNNEAYGRGPGIQVMPEIKLVNAMERDILTAVEKMVNPSWLQPDDASSQPDGRPNGITYWDASNINNKPEQIGLKNNVDLGEQKTEQKRQRIRSAFYNPLFQMLTNMEEQKREKTAYEVQQMVAEKLILFSPLFGKIIDEKVTPTLARTVDIMAREGELAPAPPGVTSLNFKVSYKSKIALALKAAHNQSFATMMTLVEQVSAIYPAAVNVIDWDAGLRDVAGNVGLNPKIIRSKRDADAITAAQQQQAAAAQAAQTGEVATRAVKNLGPQAQTQAARKIIGGAAA